MSQEGSEVKGCKDGRARYWAFEVYPESAVSDWQEALRDTHVPCAISPLHNRDFNKDGTPTKPHHHVMLYFHGKISMGPVLEIVESLNAPKYVERVASGSGYFEYLWHKNDPDKAQYNQEDVKLLNGFVVPEGHERSYRETLAIQKNIQRFIRERGIIRYNNLMDALLDADLEVEYEVASQRTMFFNAFINGQWQESKDRGQGRSCEQDN